jgi:hypothetical protein
MSGDNLEILTVKIPHPEHGYVIFSQLSSRQLDILVAFTKILETRDKYPNDKEFGEAVRKLLG